MITLQIHGMLVFKRRKIMPKVTIWIKNEDLDKWNAIADRPAWIHENLIKEEE